MRSCYNTAHQRTLQYLRLFLLKIFRLFAVPRLGKELLTADKTDASNIPAFDYRRFGDYNFASVIYCVDKVLRSNQVRQLYRLVWILCRKPDHGTFTATTTTTVGCNVSRVYCCSALVLRVLINPKDDLRVLSKFKK